MHCFDVDVEVALLRETFATTFNSTDECAACIEGYTIVMNIDMAVKLAYGKEGPGTVLTCWWMDFCKVRLELRMSSKSDTIF